MSQSEPQHSRKPLAFTSAGHIIPDVNGGELSLRRREHGRRDHTGINSAPTIYAAVGLNPAGVIRPGADGGEPPLRHRCLAQYIPSPAFDRAALLNPAGVVLSGV